MKFKLARVALVFLFVIFFISINFVDALLDNVTVSRADSIASNGSMAEFRKTVLEHPNKIPFQLVEQYYESIGSESMLDVVEENSFCHLIGHNIGRVTFLKTRNLEKSLEICRHRCTNGCFHGALMALFEGPEPENVSHSSDKPHTILPTINSRDQRCNYVTNRLSISIKEIAITHSATFPCILGNKTYKKQWIFAN